VSLTSHDEAKTKTTSRCATMSSVSSVGRPIKASTSPYFEGLQCPHLQRFAKRLTSRVNVGKCIMSGP
jgi:hypothetical protein